MSAPLLDTASDLPDSAPSAPLMQPAAAEPGWLDAWLPPRGSHERTYVLAAAAVACAAAAAALAVGAARRRRAGNGGGGRGPLGRWA